MLQSARYLREPERPVQQHVVIMEWQRALTLEDPQVSGVVQEPMVSPNSDISRCASSSASSCAAWRESASSCVTKPRHGQFFVSAGGYHDCSPVLGRRRAVRLLRLEEDPRGDRLELREVLRGRRKRVAIHRLQVEPFVVEELEGLLDVLAFLQSLSLGLLVLLPLHLRLGFLRQELRVRRALLLRGLVRVLFRPGRGVGSAG